MNIFNQTYQLSKEKKYNTSMKKFFFFYPRTDISWKLPEKASWKNGSLP